MPLCDSSHEPDWNGATAVSSSGIPALADRTAASTQVEEMTGATEAKDASLHKGLADRQRAGTGQPGAKKPTPHPSALIVPWRCRLGA
jgi:hypothetical protein